MTIRENVEDEENAGDETLTPPAIRKTSILDTLRPRSKSDAYATYKQRKSSFLSDGTFESISEVSNK